MESALLQRILALIYLGFGVITLGIGLMMIVEGDAASSRELSFAIWLVFLFAGLSFVGGSGLLLGRAWGRMLLLVESVIMLVLLVIGFVAALGINGVSAAAILGSGGPLGAITGLLWQLRPSRGTVM